ncbi:protein ARV1-like [Lingula anatina]|uniref:Protein ARV n=1 Tax=Lingula anatina TaxID=7574 RepID=A0A1S3JVE7_LINAN|nr:protein ARV1-like [Lingula anatina]|eukprot:XP_013414262.1 protein ARV1-like [Lingula anatina]
MSAPVERAGLSGPRMQRFVCVECGMPAVELYRDFKRGVMKISHCDHCTKVVDKYVEYDSTIVFLDMLLLKTQAYRHVLLNADSKNHWKFAVLFLLTDAYTKWTFLRIHGVSMQDKHSDTVLYAALELNFHKALIMSCFEALIFYMTVYICLKILISSLWRDRRTCIPRLNLILGGILLSNFGKLLVIPATIWGQADNPTYILVIRIFLIASNVQACKGKNQRRTYIGLLAYFS